MKIINFQTIGFTIFELLFFNDFNENMPRILAIDYGLKRTGLAVTDPLKIIATALETVETKVLLDFLKKYVLLEDVECFVLGLPVGLDSKDTDSTSAVKLFYKILELNFPSIPIRFEDERFTSKMASRVMIESGMKKKDRRIKGNVDKISAVIILQSFLNKSY